jgi:hypothetical protein
VLQVLATSAARCVAMWRPGPGTVMGDSGRWAAGALGLGATPPSDDGLAPYDTLLRTRGPLRATEKYHALTKKGARHKAPSQVTGYR